MASPSTSAKTTTFALPRLRDLIEHDDEEDDLVEEEEDDNDEEDWDVSRRMSRLSVAGSDGGDADDEDDGRSGVEDDDDEEDEAEEARSDGAHGEYGSRPWHPYGSPGHLKPPSSASLPGTPERGAPSQSQSPWGYGYSKDYASETEAARWPGGAGPQEMRRQQHRRQRMMREVWLDRAWQMRKQRRELGDQAATVLVGGSPARGGGVAMDMDEVRACKDLGFDLPCDWTVEIPSYAVVPNAETGSSGGNSPASGGSWRISSPGDDPKEVKARLKVWAQAVALTSASRLGP
ncbi:hypothetical protein ACQ4PT_050054 [Festuca glaucescens]